MSAVVLFDGVCNFCDSSVNFIIERDRDGYFKFAPLQSEAGGKLAEEYSLNIATAEDAALDAEAIDSVILIDNGKVYTHSAAAIRIARRIGIPWSLLVVFLVVPAPIRDLGYKLFARNRYRFFGKKDSCMMPTPEIRARFLT